MTGGGMHFSRLEDDRGGVERKRAKSEKKELQVIRNSA
jgi:hypothetical protein